MELIQIFMDYKSLLNKGKSPQEIKNIYIIKYNRRFPNRELNSLMSALNERVHFIENNDREYLRSLSESFSKTSVLREAYKLGLPKLVTTYEVVKPVFWDELTAYVYGYFVGDGCIHQYRGDTGTQMDISSSDYQIILDLKNRLSLGKILTNPKEGYDDNYRICWTSKEWYQFFIKAGLMRGKSKYDLSLKIVPEEPYVRHFIRGLIDSDGTISTYWHKGRFECYLGFLGNYNLVSQVYSILKGIDGVYFSFSASKKQYQISASSMKTLKRMYDYLYEDSTICLERKRIKVEEFLKVHNLC